jgi:hypothetical protein
VTSPRGGDGAIRKTGLPLFDNGPRKSFHCRRGCNPELKKTSFNPYAAHKFVLFRTKSSQSDLPLSAGPADGTALEYDHNRRTGLCRRFVSRNEQVSIDGAPGFSVIPAKKVTDMFKSKARDRALDGAENAAESIVQPQRSLVKRTAARPEPTARAGTASCIGPEMSIVGNIACNGPAQVFGRVEGELRASDLLIGDGAQVEGNFIAQEVTVSAGASFRRPLEHLAGGLSITRRAPMRSWN